MVDKEQKHYTKDSMRRDAFFSKEKKNTLSKLSTPNNFSLENSNSLNYPHIEIGDH